MVRQLCPAGIWTPTTLDSFFRIFLEGGKGVTMSASTLVKMELVIFVKWYTMEFNMTNMVSICEAYYIMKKILHHTTRVS